MASDEPQLVAPDDLGLAYVAVVEDREGHFLGNATLLSPNIAVTSDEVVLGQDAAFIQLRPSPHFWKGSKYLAVGDLVLDSAVRFAILAFSGRVPLPKQPGMFGVGQEPPVGATCSVMYYDTAREEFFRVLGRVDEAFSGWFRLALGWGLSAPISGCPVLSDGRIVGIVVSGLHPDSSVSESSYPTSLDVLGITAMAESKMAPAVRNLLGRRGAESSRSKRLPTSGVITQGVTASLDVKPAKADSAVGDAEAARSATLTLVPGAEGEPAPVDLSDAGLFKRLSPRSRTALGSALGMQHSADQRIHMEYLIAGLYDSGGPTRHLLEGARIDRSVLESIFLRTVGTEIPESYKPLPLAGLPPMSGHVRAALTVAAKVAGLTGPIRSRHLLYGALSVDDCRVVRALVELGVNKRDIVLSAEPPGPEVRPAGANPTPKVDSDLWSEVDQLGYEAYARTIASLITHKETKPPLTIGIKAPWGAGKTTLMKRVQHLLDGDSKLSEENRSGTMQQGQPSQVTLGELLKELKNSATPARLEAKRSKDGEAYGLEARTTVWFNAWKYQTSEQIWAGMAHCIISQITARMGVKERELFWLRLHARRVNADEVRRKVYEMIARQLLPLALVVSVAVAIVIWVAAGIQLLMPFHFVIRGVSVLAGLIVIVGRAWTKLGDKAAGTVRDLIREPNYEGKMGYLHLVESDIREVLQLATAASATQEKPEGNPLVVFVDDLDRCAPNKVAEVVEAINLFLCGDYPNCVFVIGMEPGMVAAALEVANKDVIEKAEEMGLMDRTVPVGWRFMEKIVQLPIMIPPPTEAGRRGYASSLTGLSLSGGPVIAKLVRNADEETFEVRPSRPPEYGPEEEAKVRRYLERIGPAKNAREAASKGEHAVAQAPKEERWAAQEAGNRVYERTLSEFDPIMARFAEEVAQLVADGNPRQIKRYLNVFRFYSTLRHSLRLEGVIPSEDLPSDKVLAKFVALSIQWPHAVDCLRVQLDGADGQKVSRLKLMETESRKVTGDDVATDSAWEKFVGKDGLGMGAWAEKRAFRKFLSRGESLCAKEGHGLW